MQHIAAPANPSLHRDPSVWRIVEGIQLGDEDRPTRSVLAIDDDEDILDVVRAFLDTLGYDVVTTTDAEQVLVLVAARTFDVVICDIAMPKHDGLELSEQLRASGYRGKLVLMTGWDTDRVEIDERSKSCDLLLKKPFLGAELVHAIDKLFAS